ncbi:MAG: pyridoxine 5'-phosphate synthase [Balneolaceae bacterium]|nr:pyridoxine 5'-phosphate synthase [Balneolaceae bacterium]
MQLLVNIDHVATLRNARGEGYPSPVEAARVCEKAGANGIVFHLRKDRRHIRDEDVYALKKHVKGTLDFEMAATYEMLEICLDVQPHLITLVPESREELTTEGGLKMTALYDDFEQRVFPKVQDSGIEISLFLDPNPEDIELAKKLGSDAIELHTGAYANAQTDEARNHELDRLKEAAEMAHEMGLKVNAGHGLNLKNLGDFVNTVPHLHDVSIGHALISTAVFRGLENTVKAFMKIINEAG